MRRFFSLLLIATVAVACTKNIDSDVYTHDSVGQVSETYQGVVLSVRDVTVQSGDTLMDNGWGLLIGGAAGGLAGTQVGSGTGNIAGVLGGAVIGGAAGALAQSEASKQPALEYIVKVTISDNLRTTSYTTGAGEAPAKTSVNRANEKIFTTVQGRDARFAIGQKVFLIITRNGRVRVVGDQSGAAQVNQPVIDAARPH